MLHLTSSLFHIVFVLLLLLGGGGREKGCLMCVSVRELYKGLWEGRMIMDPLMMWPSLMWILAVMRGRQHEYSEAPSPRGRERESWTLKVTLEGNGGQDSGAGSAFKTASTIKQRYSEIPENRSRNLAQDLFWSERWIFTFGWVRWKPFGKLLKDDRLTFNVCGWKQLQRYWFVVLFPLQHLPTGAFIPNPSISAAENLIYEGYRLQQQQTCTRYEITPWENYSLFDY